MIHSTTKIWVENLINVTAIAFNLDKEALDNNSIVKQKNKKELKKLIVPLVSPFTNICVMKKKMIIPYNNKHNRFLIKYGIMGNKKML
jgi:hypothetical protein